MTKIRLLPCLACLLVTNAQAAELLQGEVALGDGTTAEGDVPTDSATVYCFSSRPPEASWILS